MTSQTKTDGLKRALRALFGKFHEWGSSEETFVQNMSFFETKLDELTEAAREEENHRCLQRLEDIRPTITWDSSIDHRVQSSIIETCQDQIALDCGEDDDVVE